MDEQINIRSLVVFEKLQVGPIEIKKDRILAPYVIEKANGEMVKNDFIYSYDEAVFDPKKPESQNLASMMAVQVALNYGLFCKEIVFDGLFDDTDRRFLIDMMENTSREIYVNKILFENEFLKERFKGMLPEKQKKYTAADVQFVNTIFTDSKLEWTFMDNDKNRYAIMSSGGKDSLLTYGVMNEIGKITDPIYINESGRHWFTALNSFREMKSIHSNTGRVWCNSDRIFVWILRHLSFIREDFDKIRADMYPVRLWTVAVFLFGVLPLAHKRRAGRILIGDEYDTTVKGNYQGITHYNSLFDQSKYFDNALSRYYMKKGWNMSQFSILRSLSELLIMKILVKRYPELQKHQVSCHASHEKEGRIYPCGNCEKCRRIVGMLSALDENPQHCGYNEDQIKRGLTALGSKKVKQIGSDAAQLYYMLHSKNLIEDNDHTRKLAKEHAQILKLRFDNERSMLADIPRDIRAPILKIFLEYSDAAVTMKDRKWVPFDVLNSPEISDPYPFEFSKEKNGENGHNKANESRNHMWEELTWPEITERLKIVDTAILPCGAIEQHGPHLPVDVDSFDAKYLAAKVAEACSDPKPFVLPTVHYGVSYHHDDFKGTLSVTNEGLYRFIYDVGMSLAKNGIKKLIILNGHGDNAPTLNFAAQMINRDARIFVCIDTGETSDQDLDDLIETQNDIHAGEIETSTTLAIRPELVKMDKAVDATLGFGSTYLDFSSSRGVPWYVRTKKITETGIMGNPLKATAEKGKMMWEIMIAHLVKFVEEIKNSDVEELYQKRY